MSTSAPIDFRWPRAEPGPASQPPVAGGGSRGLARSFEVIVDPSKARSGVMHDFTSRLIGPPGGRASVGELHAAEESRLEGRVVTADRAWRPNPRSSEKDRLGREVSCNGRCSLSSDEAPT